MKKKYTDAVTKEEIEVDFSVSRFCRGCRREMKPEVVRNDYFIWKGRFDENTSKSLQQIN